MTGSYCTFGEVIPQIKRLCEMGYDVYPIMSGNSYETDTRFGKSKYFIQEIEEVCGKKIMSSVKEVEPIGPKRMLDLLIIAPCTGNTIGKLATGIYDTSVTSAAKAHLRNGCPLVLAVSTNDALSGSAKNIGSLMNTKHIYFVPMRQDDPENKPTSVVAVFDEIPKAIESALLEKQVQPVYR